MLQSLLASSFAGLLAARAPPSATRSAEVQASHAKSSAVSPRSSLLARLAAAAGACAVLAGAAAALGQDYRHHESGGGRPQPHAAAPWTGGAPRPAPWAGRPAPQVVPRPSPGGPPGGWNPQRYNGYWSGGRWYYGAPQGPAYAQPGFRPGFIPWRRGAYLPPQYQAYVIADYARFHLRRPPYGYEWVQVGAEFLMISAATGLIFDVIDGY
jgi:Ni/Co efflux regulator RcnB